MDSHQPCGNFQKESKDMLQHLEHMRSQLDNYKPLLQHNASCAEFEIKANFHNLIETLNNRQSTLLHQLDRVFKEKIALIERQQQTLVTLSSSILSSIASGHANDPNLPDLLSRACSAVISSSSDPFISFRNEQTILREAILKYGRVVSRYSGHFADPSRPSTSLPSAVEEEDDDQTTHERRVVSNHSPKNCSVEPALRRWLAQPDAEQDFRKTNELYESSLQYLFGRNAQTREKAPTCSVPGWISSVSADQVKPQLTGNFPHFSFWAPQNMDYSAPSDSASYSVLSRTSRSNSLNDWLFCDPQVGDMPGLTKPISPASLSGSQQAPFQTQSGRFSTWLYPTQSTNVQPAPLSSAFAVSGQLPLSPNVARLGSIDLGLWLAPDIEDQLSTAPTENESISSSTYERQVIMDDPIYDTRPVPDCCIYSECRGGPGGPTCCGARSMCATDKPKREQVVVESSSEVAVPISSSDASLAMSDPIQHLKVPFDKITSAHWTRWLPDHVKNEIDDETSSPRDRPILHDQTQTDCPSPPKRPSLAGDIVSPEDEYSSHQVDYYSMKLDTGNPNKPACNIFPHKIELDEGILHRMSTLSTGVVNSPLYRDWLVDVDST